jgi:hypothetical protein
MRGFPFLSALQKSLPDIEREYGVVFVNGEVIEKEAEKEESPRESSEE